MVTLRPKETGLKELLNKVRDKGEAVDAKVRVDLGSTNVTNIKAQVILGPFKTAMEKSQEFPEGIDFDALGWRNLSVMAVCPVCGMKCVKEDLKKYGCTCCGWNFRP